MTKFKILYWASTGLLSAMMLMSAGMYIGNHAEMVKGFVHLGYPAHLVYPLAIAKIAGVIALLVAKPRTLTLWAYAGFTYVFILAAMGHGYAGENVAAPLVALALAMTSYGTLDKARP
jgi:hypothetical protein